MGEVRIKRLGVGNSDAAQQPQACLACLWQLERLAVGGHTVRSAARCLHELSWCPLALPQARAAMHVGTSGFKLRR